MTRYKFALLHVVAATLVAAQAHASPRTKPPAPPASRRPMPAPDDPDGAMRWRRLAWLSADGTIPKGALARAIEERRDNLAWWQSRQSLGNLGPASWTSRGPQNVGGRTRSIVVHPTQRNVLWAGAVGGGVWKSSDSGASWKPCDDFMLNLAIGSLALDPANPNVLYAGTGEGQFNYDALGGLGIFKSTDGGASFAQMPGTEGFGTVNHIAISRSDSKLMLVSTRYGGIQRTTDGGATWTNPHWAQGSFFVAFDPKQPTNAVASVIDYDWNVKDWFHQALYSLDAGATWSVATGLTQIWGFGSRIELAYAPSFPKIVYANSADQGGKVWQSLDGGQAYVMVTGTDQTTSSWYSCPIWVSPKNPNFLVVGGYRFYKSSDGGATLSAISDGYILTQDAHPDEHCIVSDPGFDGTGNKRVYVCGDGGMFRTEDITTASPGAGWASLVATYQTTQFYGADGDGPSGLVVGGTQDNGTLRSNPASTDVTMMFGGDGGWCAIDWQDPNYIYGEYVSLHLHRSTNNGWTSDWIDAGLSDAGTAANFIAPFILDPNEPRRLLAGGAALWRTNDARAVGGPAWEAIRPAGSDLISAIAVAPGDANEIWVAQNNAEIWKTTDGLAAAPTWLPIDDNAGLNPLPNRYPTRILVDPDDKDTVYIAFGGFEDGDLQRTTDGGTTWTDVTGSGSSGLPLATIRGIARQPGNKDRLYVGTEVGVYSTTDGGATWAAANEGPANVSVDELVFMHGSTVLLAATHGRGLWTAETCATGPVGAVGNTLKLAKLAAGTTIAFRWTDAAGATRHDIYDDTSPAGGFAQVAGSGGSGSPGVSLAAPAATTYYRVAGASDCSVGPK